MDKEIIEVPPVKVIVEKDHVRVETDTHVGVEATFMGNRARFSFSRHTITDDIGDHDEETTPSCCPWLCR